MPDHTGQRRDDPGLLFYNARYYDPAIGRFISADTVVPGNASGGMDGVALRPLTVAFHEPGFIATLNSEGANADKLHWGGPTNPQSLNRYAYVNNNPMRWTDPTGHWTFSLGFTISGGGLLGGTYSMGFIWDGYGVGMFTSDSVGVTAGFSGGVGANITITNADKMEDTGGAGIFVGFNGPFRVGSGDVVMGLDSSAKPKVSNVGLSAGVGFGLGGDVHIQGSTTKVGRIIYQDPDGAKKHKPSGRDPVPAPVPVKTPPNPNATPVPRKP